MTLALLLTAATGAWADGIVCTASDLGKVLCTDGSIYENVSAATTAGKEAAAVIAYVDETNKNGLALALTDENGQTWDNSSPSNEGKTAPEICSALNTSKAVTGGTWKLPSQDEWKQMFSANGGNEESYTGLKTAIGNAGGTALKEYGEYWSSTEVDDGDAWLVNLADGNASWDTYGKHYSRCIRACLAFDIAAASITVEPGSSANTWTFTMPGSDVVLTPIYANAAAFATTGTGSEATTLLPAAAEGVIAGTDASLIADGTGIVANIGETTTAQGTLMYAIGTSATQAPALTAFNATVPTAESYDDAATVYVWYYIQGADAPENVDATLDNTFNDTEPACLTVQVLTNKFDITFNAANANTIEAGKATVTVDGTDKTVTEGKLQGVKMGSEVKLKANPGYKFRKVEVKKAASAPTLKDALADGATVVITYTWFGTMVTTFTYTNNGGNYTGSTTGSDAPNFSNGMSKDGTTLKFTASNPDFPDANVSIDFYTDTNEYSVSKGSSFTSFTISVNGTDVTSQLTKVK